MKKTKAEAKISKVMREYKSGTLHSGKKGPEVTSRKQAIAIALSLSINIFFLFPAVNRL